MVVAKLRHLELDLIDLLINFGGLHLANYSFYDNYSVTRFYL